MTDSININFFKELVLERIIKGKETIESLEGKLRIGKESDQETLQEIAKGIELALDTLKPSK